MLAFLIAKNEMLVIAFVEACGRPKFGVNAAKSEVVFVVEREDWCDCSVGTDVVTLGGSSEFVCLAVAIDTNGGCKKEVDNCLVRGRELKCNKYIREKGLSMDAVRGLYKGTLVPT